MTAAVHARDSMAAGALVNHPLPERETSHRRGFLKIAETLQSGVKNTGIYGNKRKKEPTNEREDKSKMLTVLWAPSRG